jgi:hypothetical protein
MMNPESIVLAAFKKEVRGIVKAYGIQNTVKQYGFSGPFSYFPKDTDLVWLLEQLFPEYVI